MYVHRYSKASDETSTLQRFHSIDFKRAIHANNTETLNPILGCSKCSIYELSFVGLKIAVNGEWYF